MILPKGQQTTTSGPNPADSLLLAKSHVHSFMYVCGCFPATKADLNICAAHKTKNIYYLVLYGKSLPSLALEEIGGKVTVAQKE